MQTKPLVSVIIPNYNHARYLPERMESVLEQTYQNFEVIILDDCSTDNSRDVIEKYRENPHVSKIIYNEVNGGRVFKQWKKGLNLAKGDLLWIAESDDKCELTFLERLVQCFVNDSNLALAFSKSWLFNDKGEKWIMDTEGLNEGIYESRTFISRFMSRGCPMLNASSCLFSKNAFNQIDNIYTEFRCSGDRMFWTLISEQGDVAVIDDRLNHYRKHDTNTTSYGFLHGINQREQKTILDYLLEKGYINNIVYKDIRNRLMRRGVFELLQDKNLKKDIYRYWNFGFFDYMTMRCDIMLENLKARLKYKNHDK